MFLVCSHLKKVRSIAYKCGTNKAGPGPNSPRMFLFCSFKKKINDQAFPRKKRYSTPTPKNPEGPSIYNTPQKILANLEVLMKVARERLYVPPDCVSSV